MAEEPDPAPQRPGLPAVGEVVAEHPASPRASGTSPAQQRRRVVLPAPFGPRSSTHLSGRDLQVDPGQGGEPAQERDGPAELDDGFHGSRGSLRTPVRRDQGRRGRR